MQFVLNILNKEYEDYLYQRECKEKETSLLFEDIEDLTIKIKELEKAIKKLEFLDE